MHFVSVMGSISTVILTQRQLGRKSHFILSDKSEYHMINNLWIAVDAFARYMLTHTHTHTHTHIYIYVYIYKQIGESSV